MASLRRSLTAAAASSALLTAAGPSVAADSLAATRGSITEKAHTVDLVIRRGHLRARVVREVHNHGERHDQATFFLGMPPGAVAVGLRTRAFVGGRPVWYEGELLEAELAARRYRELTGIGGYYPKDPALLSWRSQERLALQVFPCPPREDKAVGYDLALPTAWVEGRDRVELPALGLEDRRAVATLRTDVPGGRLFVEGHEIPSGAVLRLDGDRVIELEAPMPLDTVGGRLAAVPFGPARALVALRFEVPSTLSEVPRGAQVVVAVDTSRSVSEQELAASMRAASAHLAHHEGRGARVAVVGYDRVVRDLTAGFVDVAAARKVLDGAPPPRGNGSAVDRAVARAAELLAATPPGAPRRLVVLHDRRARASLDPATIAPPRGTIVHVADVGVGPGDTRRDDADVWASLPRATGGLLFAATAPAAVPSGEERRDLEAALLEWARPVRVDHVAIRAAGLADEGDGVGVRRLDTLEEGASFEVRAIQEASPASAVLEGQLWSRPLAKRVAPDAAEGKLWSALVFGDGELLPQLTEPEMMILARAGGAVSPVTSYLAIEPGVRPSTEGLDENEGRGEGIGLGGIGTIGFGAGGGGSRWSPPDYAGMLTERMAEGVARCGAKGRTHLDVETTLVEIVDVTAQVRGDDPARTAARCVEEVAWAVELPADFGRPRLGLHLAM